MEEKELKPFLEKVLRHFEKDEGLVINDLKRTQGSKPGDGFMSEVFGVVVVGRTGSGEAYTNNLFIKQLPDNPTRVELCQGDAAFQNEAIFYREVEPLIPKATFFIPICYHADEKCLVLENLRAQGFVMADKENGLDLKHSELVIKVRKRLNKI
uniref:Uncharacterized protein n=1 Tax=Clastoptera arizonana TaxID=38151 RepID=A0A1B6D2I2_9HEMI